MSVRNFDCILATLNYGAVGTNYAGEETNVGDAFGIGIGPD
jgi:hypothetical protein